MHAFELQWQDKNLSQLEHCNLHFRGLLRKVLIFYILSPVAGRAHDRGEADRIAMLNQGKSRGCGAVVLVLIANHIVSRAIVAPCPDWAGVHDQGRVP